MNTVKVNSMLDIILDRELVVIVQCYYRSITIPNYLLLYTMLILTGGCIFQVSTLFEVGIQYGAV